MQPMVIENELLLSLESAIAYAEMRQRSRLKATTQGQFKDLQTPLCFLLLKLDLIS